MIEWNRVTWYSKLAAVILFLPVFLIGYYIGGVRSEALRTDLVVSQLPAVKCPTLENTQNNCKQEVTLPVATSVLTSALLLTSPKGGESLCLGDTFPITWEAPVDMDTVAVWMVIPGSTYYPVGTFPASYNETSEKGKGVYMWTVGQYAKTNSIIGGGDAFKISIYGTHKGSKLEAESPAVFSIQDCRG